MSGNYIKARRSKASFLALLLLLLLSTSLAYAQKFSFGPNIGTYFPWDQGVNRVNDVVIIAESDQGDGERMVGGFVSYEILAYLFFKAEINYFPSTASFVVYNEAEDCLFCPVSKGAIVTKNVLEFFPAIKYNVLHLGEKFSVKIIAGPSLHFQFKSKLPNVSFNGLHPGVAEVINAMDETPKPMVVFFSYGLSLDYQRLSLTARLQEHLGNSLTEDLRIGAQRFPFRLNSRYLNITLSYSFFGFKRKD